jgi:hypothetical protein
MKTHLTLKSFNELPVEKLLLPNARPPRANTGEDLSRTIASPRRSLPVAGNGVEKSEPVHVPQQAVPSSYSWVHGGLNE